MTLTLAILAFAAGWLLRGCRASAELDEAKDAAAEARGERNRALRFSLAWKDAASFQRLANKARQIPMSRFGNLKVNRG